MKTELECLPCFFRQVSRTLRYAGVNGDAGRKIMRRVGEIVEQATLDQAPARISTHLHRALRRDTGVDPYRHLKESSTRSALALLPRLRVSAASAPGRDPLEVAVRVAIAGNVIDFGIYEEFDLEGSLVDSLRLPLASAPYRSFVRALERARTILYLCDNAGEIVFDRLLLDLLRAAGKDVTAVVKGSAVINDATINDAVAAGLEESARVIDNGSDGIGTLLETCSERFLDAYRSADLVISKGQANFETLLAEKDPRIFFLFKVKCPVVARSLGRPEGDIVLMNGDADLSMFADSDAGFLFHG
ncbi:MAG: hypothetical protein A2X56_15000 [Nitrospirae bacterium GWC2_57_13]|nr:MAG: hypothetical protein A2X56_15000 [Nitrospirae bacterium GWC2_57_13]OGW43838.1 MAG: hypothetical protein A2X57_08075 [Nitrospirae bacterium GWD2_57_8]